MSGSVSGVGAAAGAVTGTAVTGKAPAKSTVTAANTREMFVAVGIMLATVYGASVIAGTSPRVGRLILAVFVMLLILQGVTHVNPLAKFLSDHPLTPQ